MENALLKKLLIKSGYKIFISNAPDDIDDIIGDVPKDIKISKTNSKDANAVLLFARDSQELYTSLPGIIALLKPETICWIAYPKKSSKIPSDLYLMGPWNDINKFGINVASSVSFNETWSGVRVRIAGQSKASGVGLEEVVNNEYGQFVDVKNRTVSMPDDLNKAVAVHQDALAFFESLSFTNKKEYVIWVMSAKQEATRLKRIGLTVEKLLTRKKNPAEK